MIPRLTISLLLPLLPLLLSAAVCSAANEQPEVAAVDYARDIKPLLMKRCSACHGPLKQESGLRLDAGSMIRRGGENGPAIVAGQPAKSLIIEKVTGDVDNRMPPEGKPLTPREIELLKTWIAGGAKSPADEEIVADPRQHWSYLPPERPSLPKVANAAWAANPIDAFISAGHEKRNLTPRPPAPKHVWLRRVYLDLIGLPPTRDQLRAFLADSSSDADEKVVDRLLDDKAYGERWGRHWMDVWRYSDWYGRRAQKEIRYSQYHIWRWRDWIIESLNADKGYDRMLMEMLAADELAPGDQDALRATGFLARNWYKFNRAAWMQETVEHTSMGFLGLTLKCARCHDHKFDPIPQLDYYRFRAFFEPHDVRIDPISAETDPVKEGLPRVFDKQADAPTYLFMRGDDRYPDKEHPLTPAVPASLGNTELNIQPVSLPIASFYPGLQTAVVNAFIEKAQTALTMAQAEQKKAEQKAASAQHKVDVFAKEQAAAGRPADSKAAAAKPPAFLADNFAKPRPDVWKFAGGKWDYKDGRLLQSQISRFATFAAAGNHPTDFKARVRYVTPETGSYRSIGLFFDMVGTRDAQAVYTSISGGKSTVQAFHRKSGTEAYPSSGIVPCKLELNQEITLDITVRGAKLRIDVNGQLKLDYTMPLPRQPGQFAIWSHAGTAEFIEVRVEPLVPSSADPRQELTLANNAVAIANGKATIAETQLAAVKARIAAERAKYSVPPAANANELALAAGRAEQQVTVANLQLETLQAEQFLASLQPRVNDGATEPSAKPNKAVADATKKLTAVRKKLAAALVAAEKDNAKYTALGTLYPTTSTGRRLALARWIADGKNPRTARVAVNHIWLRHFGQAIVATPANFGLNGRSPSHPDLLNWLAMELSENGWKMKRLHRLIVLSNTYRMLSSDGGRDNPNRKADPENRYLWKMNSRRMQAEVVRDSVLHSAGQLDRTMGGSDLAENLGQTVPRRSLYFRLTPDSKMQFLELFDLANPNECYKRNESVIPQQALAMTNSAVALTQARILAGSMSKQIAAESKSATDDTFVTAAFEQVLSRAPTDFEQQACRQFLKNQQEILKQPAKLKTFPAGPVVKVAGASDPQQRARENLIHVLFNHNDFVTIR